MLKIGVLGTGHLGKIHIKCIQLLADTYDLVGFYDANAETAAAVAEEFGIKAFGKIEHLLEAVEVVDIVAPTSVHFELAKQALQAGKHLFIEKPVTHTLVEANQLITLNQTANRKIQIGHVERFNPAFLALGDTPLSPMFIEVHRLATFNPRGTDVPVVLDLMIHDIDIVLNVVKSPVKEVHASGVAVVSDSADIANARIVFENGAVANLTASRISLKQMRKMRLFQKDAYISLDFLEKNAQVVRLYDTTNANLPTGDLIPLQTPKGEKLIHLSMPEIQPVNAIKMELSSLAESIIQDTTPPVSLTDGVKALALAHQILEKMEVNV